MTRATQPFDEGVLVETLCAIEQTSSSSAPRLGLEPSPTGPKPAVLPLHYLGLRRNGETRTHGPLVPNQVRYLLRYIPLKGGAID